MGMQPLRYLCPGDVIQTAVGDKRIHHVAASTGEQ
jgi:hypothetical protein